MRLIGTLFDVTERWQTEEALKEADRRKDRFLAVLSHELRNPLAPIRNAAHVLRHLGAQDAAAVRALEIIERQVRHMTHLLDDLLDVGRVASGEITLRRERMDLVDLVRTAVDEQRADAEVAGLTLTATLPGAPLWTFADPTRIEQSVANLLVNAVKFTPSGGHIGVVVAAERGPGDRAAATVTVSDDGTGLEPEMMDRLFEPFAQADRSFASRSSWRRLVTPKPPARAAKPKPCPTVASAPASTSTAASPAPAPAPTPPAVTSPASASSAAASLAAASSAAAEPTLPVAVRGLTLAAVPEPVVVVDPTMITILRP